MWILLPSAKPAANSQGVELMSRSRNSNAWALGEILTPLNYHVLEETGIVRAILDIFMRYDIYEGVKTVMWSVLEETALAEAEVEYK